MSDEDRKKGAGSPGEMPAKTCPQCSSILWIGARECPDCGFVFPEPEPKIERTASTAAIMNMTAVDDWRPVTDFALARHVKDGKAPASNPFAPDAPKFSSADLDQRHAGEGDVPTEAALKAAKNVQYAVIEYDNAPGDVFEDIRDSYTFLVDGGFVA